MSYDKVRQAKELSIGIKQTRKAVENKEAQEVYVARDADEKVTQSIIDLCKEQGVPVTYVDSMRSLGEACGIEVGASSAAIVQPGNEE